MAYWYIWCCNFTKQMFSIYPSVYFALRHVALVVSTQVTFTSRVFMCDHRHNRPSYSISVLTLSTFNTNVLNVSSVDNMYLKYFKGVLVVAHYNDAIMSAMASQITSLAIVYSSVYRGADQGKHQSSASLAFVGEFNGDRWISRTKGQ